MFVIVHCTVCKIQNWASSFKSPLYFCAFFPDSSFFCWVTFGGLQSQCDAAPHLILGTAQSHSLGERQLTNCLHLFHLLRTAVVHSLLASLNQQLTRQTMQLECKVQELEREKQSQAIVNAEFQKCFETSRCEIEVLRLKLSKAVDLQQEVAGRRRWIYGQARQQNLKLCNKNRPRALGPPC